MLMQLSYSIFYETNCTQFKRKRKGDKGENIDYEKYTQIIPPGDSLILAEEKAA